jgi:hypothetical protein
MCFLNKYNDGRVAEWFKAPVLKCSLAHLLLSHIFRFHLYLLRFSLSSTLIYPG